MSRKSTSLATGFLSGLADEIKEKNKTKRELAQAMLMQQLQGQAAMEREQMAQDAAMQRQKSQLESEQVFQTGRGERQQQFDLEKLLLAKQLESSIPKALNPEEQAQAGSLQLIDRMTKLPLTRAYGQESMLAPFTPARGAIPAMEQEAFANRTDMLAKAGITKPSTQAMSGGVSGMLEAIGMAQAMGLEPQGVTLSAEGKPSLRFGKKKELTPQQKAVEQNFKDLGGAIDRIDKMLASDEGFKGQLFKTGIPFQPGAGGLADEIRNASDILLRMRSGAQINEAEFNRLSKMFPTSLDAISELFNNPDRARNKLVKFKTTVEEILSEKPSSDNEAVSEDDADWIAQLEAQGYTVEPQ